MTLKKEERGDGQIFFFYISNNMEIIQMKKKMCVKKGDKTLHIMRPNHAITILANV